MTSLSFEFFFLEFFYGCPNKPDEEIDPSGLVHVDGYLELELGSGQASHQAEGEVFCIFEVTEG